VGVANDWLIPGATTERLLASDLTYQGGAVDRISMPWYADAFGRYRLGPWLAQAAAAYRDGVQYVQYTGSTALQRGFEVLADSHLRSGFRAGYGSAGTFSIPYRPRVYGTYGGIRGAAPAGPNGHPQEYGFVTVGELLNVKGFDSSPHNLLPPLAADATTTTLGSMGGAYNPSLWYVGDYVKAVSLTALIDSQYLTTRSNTFTVYASVMDREDPQASVRSQVTIDRSNLLPRLTYAFYDPIDGYYPLSMMNDFTTVPSSAPSIAALPVMPLLLDQKNAAGDPGQDGVRETPMRLTNDDGEPQVLAKERVGYFNARYDD